jgi:hypothetical protein
MRGRARVHPDKTCKRCGGPIPRIHNFGTMIFCGRKCYYAHRASPEGIAERFWSFVERTEGCWLFRGCIGHEGYGSFAYGNRDERRQFQAHRFSWMLVNGAIPKDKFLCHTCDVRACVNPAHLYLGDHKTNAEDCIARGRRSHRYQPVETLLFPHLSRRGQLSKDRSNAAQSESSKEKP